VPPIPAEANGDAVADSADYTLWSNNFASPLDDDVIKGEIHADGEVEAADSTLWVNNFSDILLAAEPLAPAAPASAGFSLFLASGASSDSTDLTTSTLATVSPPASTSLSATSPDVFFIRTPTPAALESPSLLTVEPVPVPVDSASTNGVATSALGCTSSDQFGQPSELVIG
jgi:hypothetical protein